MFHQIDLPEVNILLSTFNGGNYLEDQLHSLINQNYPKINIFIRDDGSSDQTTSILSEYSKSYKNISVLFGNNIGTIRSFIELLMCAAHKDGYFAFCDQDDIWHPDKVFRAVKILQSLPTPEKSLYFSRMELIDTEGHPLGLSDIPRCFDFHNAIVENVVTGATAVFGSEIRDLMLRANPEHMVWHDWWLYLVATAFGEVVYDHRPGMQSRRYPGNQTTMRIRSREGLRAKLNTLNRVLKRKRTVHVFQQAEWFDQTYSSLLSDDKRNLLQWLGCLHREGRWRDRWRFSLSQDFVINDSIDSIGLRMLVLLGYKI